MTEIIEYMTDPEPAEAVVKETTRPPLVPRKPPVQRTASRLGVPELTVVATDVLKEQAGQEEPQLDTVMEEGHADPEQNEGELDGTRPAHIRKNTKDVRVTTIVNQAVTSEINHLEKQIQENEAAIRESDRELAVARKAAHVSITVGGTRVTQVQAQTATGLLKQMETLNPNPFRFVQAASVPMSQQEHPVPARTSSNGNPVVNGRISLPPVITSGLAANPVRGSSNVAVPISNLTTVSVPATVIPSSSVQVPATVTTVTTDQQAAVSAPNRTQEQLTIPVSTTTPAVATTTREGGARYTQEYQRDVKGKQLEEPAMQAQTPGAGASRPHSGCTRERQASGGELPGDTPATTIDPEETNSPPKAAPSTGS
ncbi:hypothetical protein R1sor_018205 [Riccia sorocarpa]|uniref:Uncharacterized protein n=1 Tax=Riccia sorocarpa TaxID=122646 RepID=A0ABD3I913_9MARC